MGGKYAEGTTVDVAKSKMEIEQTLTRYGARKFVSGFDEAAAFVMFEVHGRYVRFSIPVPTLKDTPTTDGNNRTLSPQARENKRESEEKRRWRALLLAIKAKLEVVESDIATFEQEFGMHIVAPDGRTVGEHVLPAIEEMYSTGQMPDFFGGMRALGPGVG